MGRRLAFYAPLKSPTHAVPSGDRRMARALITAFEHQGHEVSVASHFRSFDRNGDRERQERIQALGDRLAKRLIRRYKAMPRRDQPLAWVTYHAYHKSPDWLGPAVRSALDIPYILIETSFAEKQACGPWALGHRATEQVIQEADVILALTGVDHAGLAPVVREPTKLQRLPPFLDPSPFTAASKFRRQHRHTLAERFDLDDSVPWLLTVGMMRNDVKLQSYKILCQALQQLLDRSWQILVVGAGPSLPLVESYLARLGSKRVRMAGILNESELVTCYNAADLYAWPAIREAYGLAILEAQAAGLPVVAGDEGGVADVVRDTETGLLTSPGDSNVFALAVADLLDHPGKRRSMGKAAKLFVERERSLVDASRRLDQALIDASDIFRARQHSCRMDRNCAGTSKVPG